MEYLQEFVGRFHPLLVHLPIGILLIAVLFVWLKRLNKLDISITVITLMVGLGALAAILSVFTGFLLSRNGEYDLKAVQWHQWMGIGVAVISSGVWTALKTNFHQEKALKWGSLLIFGLVIVAGHLGGSLARGSSYLTEPLVSWLEGRSTSFDFSEVNVQEARLYPDIIRPILQSRCLGCHGAEKQKGKLRLDDPVYIAQGGKNGKVIELDHPDDSEILKRIHLALNDEHHMPPKERKQLSRQEIAWITLWIEGRSDFEKPLLAITTLEKIDLLIRMSTVEDTNMDIPKGNVSAPDDEVVKNLLQDGISVTPIADGSNYLQVNFTSVTAQAKSLIAKLDPLSKNVIWLKLSNSNIDDHSMEQIGKLTNLTRLSLDHTSITDTAMETVASVKSLFYLNLNGTQVTLAGLSKLKELADLRQLFLYQTRVNPEEQQKLAELLPNTRIEWGGYQVPELATDTMVVKKE